MMRTTNQSKHSSTFIFSSALPVSKAPRCPDAAPDVTGHLFRLQTRGDQKQHGAETAEMKVKEEGGGKKKQQKTGLGIKHVLLAFDRRNPELDSSKTAD